MGASGHGARVMLAGNSCEHLSKLRVDLTVFYRLYEAGPDACCVPLARCSPKRFYTVLSASSVVTQPPYEPVDLVWFGFLQRTP